MKTILTSELEKRHKLAADGLKQLGGVIDDLSKNLSEGANKSYRFDDKNNQLVYKAKEVKTKGTTESMVSFGGGVKARVLRNDNGSAVIESYFFDKDRFDKEKAVEWLDKNSKTVESSFEKIQESMPAGSFEDITARLYTAITASAYFSPFYDPMSDCGPCFYIVCVFPERAIVQFNSANYEIPYTDANGEIKLGDPKEVTTEFVAKESAALKQSFQGEKINGDFHKLSIQEGSEQDKKREIVAVLIEEGKNYSKKRYYPAEVIKEAALIFAGLKNFIDHPTAEEERAKPERSLDSWVSTILESWYEDGKVLGRIHVHDDKFWEKIKNDPVFRENIGLSINASGKSSFREVDGQTMQYIEKIMDAQSVDWVTEPGARGRVLSIVESKNKEQGVNEMKNVTLKEVQEQRPDLIEAIQSQHTTKMQADFEKLKETAIAEAVAPFKTKIAELESKEIKAKESAKVAALVNDSKLPAPAKARLIENLSKEVFGDEAKLTEAVKKAVEAETKYLSESAGIKIGVGAGEKGSDTVAGPLLEALGLGEKKK